MIEPFLWLWWLNVEPHFITFLTCKEFRPRRSLKIGWFGPGFQWTKWRAIFWKEDHRIFDQFALSLFSARTFYWGFSHFEKCNFLNSNISVRIFIVGIANLILICEFNKIDELNIENRIEIDRSEAEKYEFIHESCAFSLLFFQPYIIILNGLVNKYSET